MIIIFVEGKSDLMFLLGVLGIRSTRSHRDRRYKYECCCIQEAVCICDGGGKDQICNRAAAMLQDYGAGLEIHTLPDGDARDVDCGGAVQMHYLNHRSLDHLIFKAAPLLLKDIPEAAAMLEQERHNQDGKKKAYPAMYLTWKHRHSAFNTPVGDYWTTIHDFYHVVGLELGNKARQLDPTLAQLIELITSHMKPTQRSQQPPPPPDSQLQIRGRRSFDELVKLVLTRPSLLTTLRRRIHRTCQSRGPTDSQRFCAVWQASGLYRY
ncbi:hypothetical protein ODS41_07735 [Pyrobaculum sp. 3827-6]|uniref:hypothetical protein n=1 Tax=Pyrobaculum sp. 3827-6 TaxID=2983604 RepID=UPI0021D8A238|nr:hypothetical protein [Pyrobaculum sp. 3827-6]MCU7787802.1 hypothetical protein [Pyrobaculum sp. 3827-6]